MRVRRQRRILIADDDRHIVRIIRVKLERHGYVVEAASNGKEALERVRANPPDLLLLDVMMPVMDGLSLVRRLKDDPVWRLIPVFVLTARGQMADKKIAFHIGVEEYITKPFSPMDVLRRIDAYFERLEE